MQYVGRAIGTVSRTWQSINPSTLSGAIDVVVVRHESEELKCSAFHIRFGKLSLLQPSEKRVDFYVNGERIDVQMKLGEGGEAFFVFETEANVPENLLTSPVVSPVSSPDASPSKAGAREEDEVDYLDLGVGDSDSTSRKSGSPGESQDPVSESERVKDALATAATVTSEAAATVAEAARVDAAAQQIPGFEQIREQDPGRIDEIIRRLREVNIPSVANDNGEVIIDMTGYKPGGRNTRELEEVVQDIFSNDFHDMSYTPPGSPPLSPPGSPGMSSVSDMSLPASPRTFRPVASDAEHSLSPQRSGSPTGRYSGKHFVKTLRLSSDVLRSLNLKDGPNDMKFVVRSNGATVTGRMHLWDARTPVVISDIDGTITRSDALGHVMTMIGRDWTHAGVAKLFTDISQNGYNIMYLTSRSVGLADVTRGYLLSIEQDGFHMPSGPVILSPDRTIAALRREVIMRKPEIFKMACLRDIAKLYKLPPDSTPFYAGFGNRITDGLSYRSVGVPSTKIFTINTDSEVRMELLHLTGYKSTYILISDLVDHFFPPVTVWVRPGAIEFSDANFWRSPLPELSDDSDAETSGARLSDSAIDYESRLHPRFENSNHSDSEEYTPSEDSDIDFSVSESENESTESSHLGAHESSI